MFERLLSLLVFDFFLSLSRVSLPFVHSLHLLYPGHLPPYGRNRRVLKPLRTRRMRKEYCHVAIHNPLTGYEPKQLDNFDCSETAAAIFQDESVDIDTEPSYSCDAELDDELIGKELSSPLFIQEREEPAHLRQTYHSHEESLLPAQSFFTRTSTGRPVYEPSSDLSQKRKSSRDLANERIRILLERQKKNKFLLKSDLRSRSTNFKPSLIKEVSRN